MLTDRLFRKYLASTAPPPAQKHLDTILSTANRVQISARGHNFEPELGINPLLEMSDAREIDTLKAAMRIDETRPFGHCMCVGDLGLRFFAGDTLLAHIGLHHGVAIRYEGWKDDAPLWDGASLLEWLARHGIEKPLREWQETQERAEKSRADWKNWLEAVPEALRPLENELAGKWAVHDWDTLRDGLLAAFPEPAERAGILFAWFGNGSGPWSGFPSYESVPEHFLSEIEPQYLQKALESALMTPVHWRGAARYFSSWDAKGARRKRAAQLPASLRLQMMGEIASDNWRKNIPDSVYSDIWSRVQRALNEKKHG